MSRICDQATYRPARELLIPAISAVTQVPTLAPMVIATPSSTGMPPHGCEAHRHRNDSCAAVYKRGHGGAGDDAPQQAVLRLEHEPGEQTSGLQRRPDGLHDLDAEQHEREAADRKRPVADAAQPAAPADGGGRAVVAVGDCAAAAAGALCLRQRPGKPARQPDGGAREQHRHADASEAEPDQLGGEARADVRAENDA